MSVMLGVDSVDNYTNILGNKKIGLVTNHSGVNKHLVSTIDCLYKHFNLVKLFAPEHGVRGNSEAGEAVFGYTDARTALPVISLYGKNKTFSEEMLEDIDIIAIDIQDVGSRFYTYLYTMAYAMQACKKYGKTCIVFDRPNPLNANNVEGNMLESSCASFIGLYPIPQRYGLTIGECALLFNNEYGINCDLKIIAMSGYKRDMYFCETALQWVLPSPNIPTIETCLTFNCTCIFEGTNISEGRGTTKPFSFIGAPWLKAEEFAEKMNDKELLGVHFRPHYFSPVFAATKKSFGEAKYKDELCGGVEIHVVDKFSFKPIETALNLLFEIRDNYEQFEFLPPYTEKGRHMIDYNTGSAHIREGTQSLSEALASYKKDSAEFSKIKTKYHLYHS